MRTIRQLALRFVLGLLGITAGAARGQDVGSGPPGKVLTVCAVPASMPRTDKTADGAPRGLDVALVRQLGRSLGRKIEFHWCASADCAWHCLPAGRCDVVIGQPQDSSPPRVAAWSVPYALGQFGLVVGQGTPDVRALDELRGKRVGIVAGTVPLAEKDHTIVRFKSREALLEGFAAGRLDAALIDGDFAGWYLQEHPNLGLRSVPAFVPRERWNMALAVRPGDAELLVALNRSLAELMQSGALERIYRDHGVAYRTPFTGQPPRAERGQTWERVQERHELVVGFDPANLPYSSARDDRPGADVELARALAERLGVKLRVAWLDVQRETALGALLEDECDLVLGAAVDPNAVDDEVELAGKVLYSRPYYTTGYVLIRRKGEQGARSLADLKGAKGQRVGTEAGSVADYALRQRGLFRRLYRNQLATLKALSDRDIDYAYLWANAAWILHNTPEFNLELVPGYAPEDRWNIAAAMRHGDDSLLRHVNDALHALIGDGTVARCLARYHIPDFAASKDSQGRLDRPSVHPVVDRGRAPDMQRVQRSKHPYSGLERIRAAGEIVVGLDQNNLPFSTAHPTPAGLDVEIARLLAAKLGVSLRIYWAYSAHDSYPSKLATRQLCDLILGVMPDDRFGQRVLFTRPYYMAHYEWVVKAGAHAPGPQDAIAVEQGVAVLGLRGRPLAECPSTEAVLEAVATGRAAAGYVISTRGAWRAEECWPGKLDFLPASPGTDAFPICAAVRKSDRDLKDAIDRAWDDLERSGELAAIFRRWHVRNHPAASRENERP